MLKRPREAENTQHILVTIIKVRNASQIIQIPIYKCYNPRSVRLEVQSLVLDSFSSCSFLQLFNSALKSSPQPFLSIT